MKALQAMALVAGLLLAVAPKVHGNAGPPQPRPAPKNNFVVELDPNATVAKLILPKKYATGRAALDIDTDDRIVENDRPALHSIVAGVALALAISCSGLWLVRRNRHGRAGVALVLAVAIVLVGGVAVFADIGFGPRPKPPVRPAPALKQLFSGNITVEISDTAEVAKLIIGPDMAQKLADASAVGKDDKKPVAK